MRHIQCYRRTEGLLVQSTSKCWLQHFAVHCFGLCVCVMGECCEEQEPTIPMMTAQSRDETPTLNEQPVHLQNSRELGLEKALWAAHVPLPVTLAPRWLNKTNQVAAPSVLRPEACPSKCIPLTLFCSVRLVCFLSQCHKHSGPHLHDYHV